MAVDNGAQDGSTGIEGFPNDRGAFALARDSGGKPVILWIDAAHESLLDTVRRFDAGALRQNLKALERHSPDDPDLPLYRRMEAALRRAAPDSLPGEDLTRLRLRRRIKALAAPQSASACTLRYSAGWSAEAEDAFVALGETGSDGRHRTAILGRDQLAEANALFPEANVDDAFIAAVTKEVDRVANAGPKSPSIADAAQALQAFLEKRRTKAQNDERLHVVGDNPEAPSKRPSVAPNPGLKSV